MKTDPSIDRKVDEAMQSLDGMQKAEPAPFLFTRVLARLEDQAEAKTFWGKMSSFIARPTIAFALFAGVLAINISFFVAEKKSPSTNVASSSTQVDAQSDDFLLAGNSSYDYTNPE